MIRDIQPLVTTEGASLRSWPWVWVCVVPSWRFHVLVADDADQFRNEIKPCGCTVSTMDLSEARGLVLFRVVRGGIGITQRLGATGTVSSTGVWHTHPRTRASREPTGHHQKQSPEMEGALHPRRSSGLRFQFFCVEVFSLLPKCQRNGCNLARQRETRHGWLYAFRQRSLVDVLERSGTRTRHGGRTFE